MTEKQIPNDMVEIQISNNDEVKEEGLETNNKNISDHNNFFLNFIFNHSKSIFIFNILILLISLIITTYFTLKEDDLDKLFWFNQITKYFSLIIIQICMSLLVYKYNVKVNYTRKIIHISYFLLPQLLDTILIRYNRSTLSEIWNIWIVLFLLFLVSEQIRNKVKIIRFMFKSVDRPEDQPYTLIWFSTQIISSLIILIPFSIYFNSIDKGGFTFIPILINGLADGLAEPVGITFGKHKYKTKACLGDREYTRSYEGSFCVYFVSLIIILSYYFYMDLKQYIFLAILLPPIITFTEAYAPHTWDSPFLFLVSCVMLTVSNFEMY